MTAKLVSPYARHANHAIAFEIARSGSRFRFNPCQAASGLAKSSKIFRGRFKYPQRIIPTSHIA
jgi:hypothetical protein